MKGLLYFQVVFLVLALVFMGCSQPTDNAEITGGGEKTDPSWRITATPFMLKGETAVTNVKLSWPKRAGANRYEVYRDGVLIGHAAGGAFDDYDLLPGVTCQYSVKAFLGGTLTAASSEVSAATFTLPAGGPHWTYKNSTGTRTTHISSPAGPTGYQFPGDPNYYGFRTASGTADDNTTGVLLQERTSTDGTTWSEWTTRATIGTYVDSEGVASSAPGAKLEGAVFHQVGDRVVLTAHREPSGSSYALGHFLLATFTPNSAVVTYDGRPFDCDSRDQSIFVDDDGTAYVLSSGLGDTYIFRLNEDWTEPDLHINTVFVGSYRETPHILRRGDVYFFYGSRQSGWYPSQTEYSTTNSLGGEWADLAPVGNRVTNGSQFNRVEEYGDTYGLWGYRWAANWDTNSREDSNIQRLSVLAINGLFSAAEYFSEAAYYQDYGLVGIQPGRYLSLGAPVTVSVPGSAQYANPAFITDGGDMSSSGYFRGSEYPYDVEIDLRVPAVLKEINLTSHIVGGSETAYRYILYGSVDREIWTELADNTANYKPGFTIDEISDLTSYRYLKAAVYGVINVRNNSSANWAEGIIELAVYGTPQI